jgi:hypothetical protein
MVRNREAEIFPVITGDRVSLETSPICRDVLSREPSEAKMFPRMPMAAGTMIIRPGNNSSTSENVPRIIPPTSDPREASTREIIPCLKTVARTEMNLNLSAREITACLFSFMEVLIRRIIVVPCNRLSVLIVVNSYLISFSNHGFTERFTPYQSLLLLEEGQINPHAT